APFSRARPGPNGAIPRGLENGPRFLFAQCGGEPRLPLPVQLVCETDLRRFVSFALGGTRRGGNARAEREMGRRAPVVCRRHLRIESPLGSRARRMGRAAPGCRAIQDAIA